MSEYEDGKSVENKSYCMDSMEARNVKEMNEMSGYNDMSDLANNKVPSSMKGATRNEQPGATAANPRKND